MTKLNSNDFWKEIGAINNSKTPLPCIIEDANGPQEICKLWEKQCKDVTHSHIVCNDNLNVYKDIGLFAYYCAPFSKNLCIFGHN